jgi:DNA polymerase III epsilon subunit-like protein
MKIIVFDTETSGLPKSKTITPNTVHLWPFIVQFSYIIFDTDINSVVKSYDAIVKVKPYNVISKDSIKFHGITQEISASKGINIDTVLFAFISDMHNADMIVAHNVEFDLNMIRVELLRLEQGALVDQLELELRKAIFEDHTNFYCTMRESVDLCKIEKENSRGKYYKFPTLAELHKHLFEVEPKHLHNSFHDILCTIRCFIKMKYNQDIVKENPQFKELIKKLI